MRFSRFTSSDSWCANFTYTRKITEQCYEKTRKFIWTLMWGKSFNCREYSSELLTANEWNFYPKWRKSINQGPMIFYCIRYNRSNTQWQLHEVCSKSSQTFKIAHKCYHALWLCKWGVIVAVLGLSSDPNLISLSCLITELGVLECVRLVHLAIFSF
jgi:hypothetical protein